MASKMKTVKSGTSGMSRTESGTGSGGGTSGTKSTGSGGDWKGSIRVVAMKAAGTTPEAVVELTYHGCQEIGHGSFGLVYAATLSHSTDRVAIKKVLQDKRYKNRELELLRTLSHPNLVSLKFYFYSNEEGKEDIYLNLVTEYVPETLYRLSRNYAKKKSVLPILYIRLYMYQTFRAVAYLHSQGVCHRDMKPQNLLVNSSTGVLKVCDFGSAKTLNRGETNVAYICSRYYRAPELILGATEYSLAVDTWAVGCVLAELLLSRPLFPGDSSIDQLVEIIKVLGTPTPAQLQAMNPNYTTLTLPTVSPYPWSKVYRPRTPKDALDLSQAVLAYNPSRRLTPLDALAHPFFDPLRQSTTRLLDAHHSPLPPLRLSPAELAKAATATVNKLKTQTH